MINVWLFLYKRVQLFLPGALEKHATEMRELLAAELRRSSPWKRPLMTARAIVDVLASRFRHRPVHRRARENMRSASPIRDITYDLGFAWRQFLKRPVFAGLVLTTIALGIGANTAIFSVVDGVVWKPLPYPRSHRVVAVWPELWFSKRLFVDFQQSVTSYEFVAAYSQDGVTVQGVSGAEELEAPSVTGEFFNVLGVPPHVGRAFAAGDDQFGVEPTVVLSHEYWRSRFGEDPAVIGSTTLMDRSPRTIIGVMPPRFDFLQRGAQAAVPFVLHESVRDYDANYLRVIARLKPGVTAEQAQNEARGIAARWRAEYGFSDRFGTNATVRPLRDFLIRSVRPQMLLLLGAAGLILLITTANVANLLLAQALSREQEISLRRALGAGPARIARQLLTEATALGLAGGAVGFAAGLLGVKALVWLLPADTPRLAQVTVDARVLGFSIAVAVATGWIVGLVPAFQSARSDARDALIRGGRAVTLSRGRHRLRAGLVVAEVALAVLLLSGAGLLIKSFWQLTNVDLGLRPERLLTLHLSPPKDDYASLERMLAYYDDVERNLAALPGVESVGSTHTLPISGGGWVSAVQYEGLVLADGEPSPLSWWRAVTPNYFETAGMRIVSGRGFDSGDRTDGQLVAVINETAAQRFFPNRNPRGQWIRFVNERVSMNIVGVLRDVRILGVSTPTPPTLYMPLAQGGVGLSAMGRTNMGVVIRATDPYAVAPSVLETLRALDSRVPIANVQTMEEAIWEDLAEPRVIMMLLTVFAVSALALGSVGIFGVMSHLVRERMREMSIRMALGATGGFVLRSVLVRGGKIVGIGLALGIVLSLALTRILESQIVDVSPRDPWILTAVSLTLACVAGLAMLQPARRARRSDPMEVLRTE